MCGNADRLMDEMNDEILGLRAQLAEAKGALAGLYYGVLRSIPIGPGLLQPELAAARDALKVKE